jgi:hypothetical protein
MDGKRYAVISRDPFARLDIIRRTVFCDARGECAWCGQTRTTKSGRPFLYEYGYNEDQNNRNNFSGKLFCSKACHDSYLV